MALWEWVVSYAIAQHPDGLPAQVNEPAIPVRGALVAMSGHGRLVQPRELADSLVRLFGGERQELGIGDAFRASLPEWVPPLLRPGLYGYLDLAVLARLKTKGARCSTATLSAASPRTVCATFRTRLPMS
ncbi:hypothetical protein ACFQWF_04315 [Methylorubrum suomiense]